MFVFSAGPKHGSAGTVSQAGSALQEQDLQPHLGTPKRPCRARARCRAQGRTQEGNKAPVHS